MFPERLVGPLTGMFETHQKPPKSWENLPRTPPFGRLRHLQDPTANVAAATAAMAAPSIDAEDYITTSGVSVTSITANADDDSVIIAIDAEDDGVLSVTLHSKVITAFDDGTYFVLINNEEVEFEQSGNSLTIPYGAGNEKVEIVGSHAVPEFGTIAMIILAVAIVSIIAITAKTKISLIPKL